MRTKRSRGERVCDVVNGTHLASVRGSGSGSG